MDNIKKCKCDDNGRCFVCKYCVSDYRKQMQGDTKDG